MERISSDAGTKFNSTYFKDEFQTRGDHLMLPSPKNQKTNRQVEVTGKILGKISQSLMVHARVLEAYIHFTLMYTAHNILPVLPIKDPTNKDGDPTTLFKLDTGTKTSVSH